MFLVEITASFVGGSVSLRADALDFLADALNYVIALAGSAVGCRRRLVHRVCWRISSRVYRLTLVPGAGRTRGWPADAMPNRYFDSIGLPRLHVFVQA
jgi:hypothetical protein